MDPFRAAVERRAAGTYCGTKYKVLADPLEKSIKNADLWVILNTEFWLKVPKKPKSMSHEYES